jgi:hypothetical protein
MKITEEQKKQLLESFDIDPYDGAWGEGMAQGIIDTLEILGIKIKGINEFNE